MKKLLSLLLVILSIILMPATMTNAATSSSVYTKLNSKFPIVTYAMPLSGASKVYSYSSSSLSTKTTGYYICSFTDQIVITKMSSNGKAVYCTYPSTSSSTGYRSRWFAVDDILGLTTVGISSGNDASQSYTTYRMKSSSSVTSYGSIAKYDNFIGLGTHKINSKTYYSTVYNITSTKVNGVSGVKYKCALTTSKVTNISSSTNTTSSSWDSKVGKTVASIKNGSSYTKWYGSDNLSAKAGYIGQCTWYAYGRFYEIHNIKLKKARNAKYWLDDNKNDSRLKVVYGAENIKAKSIAVRKTGTWGHVMFIEQVTYNSKGSPAYVYFTECNNDGNGKYNAGVDCIVKKLSYSSFVSQKNPAGYIFKK